MPAATQQEQNNEVKLTVSLVEDSFLKLVCANIMHV